MEASDPVTNRPIHLLIVAHQWWWEVHYPNTGIVTANEIHVPVNQPEYVGFCSADVIHDFWVPELGRKIDIIPGVENHSWFSADTPGVYFGPCAEYCGKEHAWMRIRGIAQTPLEFAKWEREEMTIPEIPSSGRAVFSGDELRQLPLDTRNSGSGAHPA